MTEESTSHDPNDPTVFSRGSLKLTYDLIRKNNAQLALSVRNIITQTPISNNASERQKAYSEHFKVDLDSFQVRSIVESLMDQAQSATGANENPGRAILAKALTEDWMRLAHKMIADLPDNQKPPFAQ
ncbi:MAG: hypothetical protein JKY67_02090 [Pseudomonadales bacterium]|nr:hypothetical protein [Pseudomonadales bacterium]